MPDTTRTDPPDRRTTEPRPVAIRTAPAARLVLEAGDAGEVFPLGDAPLTAGRSLACAIRVAPEHISLRHLRVAPAGGGYAACDLGSTNGSFVNGEPLTPFQPRPLRDGDVLSLGAPDDPEPVRITFHAAAPSPAALSFALPPELESLEIGRAGAAITLAHPLVSRRHARVERAGQGHAIVDLGSTNGTLVNGRPVARRALRPGDIVQIAVFQLVYRGGQLDLYDRRGELRAEARGVTCVAERGGKVLLRDVSLAVAPYELVALIGPSGAGKSSLLGALSGQLAPAAGEVLIDGASEHAALAGIVPQEETLHRALPVGRALAYAARLRLPPDTGADEVERRVARALAEVDLEECREQPIATLSGGERRRVAIAAELLADPALFLLDEPSAGLDPGLERRLFQLLRGIADSGRAVVVATHAAGEVELCDRVAVLWRGRLLYDGPPSGAPAFFGARDVAGIYERLEREAAPPDSPAPAAARAGRRAARRPGGLGAAARQARVLTERAAELLVRDRRNLAILLAQAPLIGALLAVVARADALVGEGAAASEAKKVLFMLATTAIWCGVVNAARSVAGEWPILRRERLGGLQIGPYLLARLAVLGALTALQAAVLLLLTMLKVHLPAWGVLLPLPLELYLTTVLAGMAGLALGLLISSAAATPDRAISLVPLAVIPQILFAGVIFSLGAGLTAQRALSWLTVSRWAMDAYGASAGINGLPLLPGLLRSLEPAPEYLATPGHLLWRWAALAAWCVAGTACAGLVLRRALPQPIGESAGSSTAERGILPGYDGRS